MSSSLVDSLRRAIRAGDNDGPNWLWPLEDRVEVLKMERVLDEIGSDAEVNAMRADISRQIAELRWGATEKGSGRMIAKVLKTTGFAVLALAALMAWVTFCAYVMGG